MSVQGIFGIARSGLDVARRRLEVSAHNVANVSTAGFAPSRVDSVELTGGGARALVHPAGEPPSPDVSGTDVASEVIEQLRAERAYEANAGVIRLADEVEDELLDRLA